MEQIARDTAWLVQKNLYRVPSSYSDNRNKFFKPSPGNNVSSHHSMSRSDLTPEEQETTQKSKDPSVIVTAHETAHTTEEATVYAYDLDTFVQVKIMKNTRCALAGFPYEWHPRQPSCLIKNGKKFECSIDNHIPLVVPGAQATEHQTKVLGEWNRRPAVGDHEQRVETENTRMASTIHGRIDEVISTNHSWTLMSMPLEPIRVASSTRMTHARTMLLPPSCPQSRLSLRMNCSVIWMRLSLKQVELCAACEAPPITTSTLVRSSACMIRWLLLFCVDRGLRETLRADTAPT